MAITIPRCIVHNSRYVFNHLQNTNIIILSARLQLKRHNRLWSRLQNSVERRTHYTTAKCIAAAVPSPAYPLRDKLVAGTSSSFYRLGLSPPTPSLHRTMCDQGLWSKEANGEAAEDVSVALCAETKAVNITWINQGNVSSSSQSYPYVWLRDICRCESCFHPSSHSRIADFTALDTEVSPRNVNIVKSTAAGSNLTLKVDWCDGHVSRYSTDELRKYTFHSTARDPTFDPHLRYWGADVEETQQLKFFEFDDLLTSDRALHDWLVELQELGLAVVKNAPKQTGKIHQIGERVAFLRPCNYGPTFQVKSKIDASNAAYTSERLPLHTDLAYYIWAPGIQLLHCIDQIEGTGGENILSDGFKAAEELKQEDPEAFRILTSTLLQFYDKGTDSVGKFHQRSRHSTIRLDDGGNVAGIYWSDHGRDPILRIPEAEVLPLYRAMKKYHNKLYLPSNLFKYKMDNGDILCFNNRRTLHGRERFTVTATSSRHLEGSYLEWDEVNSKIRVLKEMLENDDAYY